MAQISRPEDEKYRDQLQLESKDSSVSLTVFDNGGAISLNTKSKNGLEYVNGVTGVNLCMKKKV